MSALAELDDATPLDASSPQALRQSLADHRMTDRVTAHLTHGDAELLVGFHGERGVCYWLTYSSNDAVSAGGLNGEVETYGLSEIAFPPHSEVPAETVMRAAEQFIETGERPTNVDWVAYDNAMQAAHAT